MFIISYAVVTVKARLISFDRHLEEAAMDLGADEWTTFRKVTLPLIAPAIFSALLLGFALSIDDFVITYFNSGSETTFPLFVWGAARVGAPPQVNVLATAIFVLAFTIAVANIVIQNRRAKGSRMTLDLQQAARDHLWLHFTRMGGYRDAEIPVIVSGDGCYLTDSNGKRYLDALAGLFSSTSATASARRSDRRRSRRCASCPSTPTGRTPIRARSSSRASSPRWRPAT